MWLNIGLSRKNYQISITSALFSHPKQVRSPENKSSNFNESSSLNLINDSRKYILQWLQCMFLVPRVLHGCDHTRIAFSRASKTQIHAIIQWQHLVVSDCLARGWLLVRDSRMWNLATVLRITRQFETPERCHLYFRTDLSYVSIKEKAIWIVFWISSPESTKTLQSTKNKKSRNFARLSIIGAVSLCKLRGINPTIKMSW